jgi:serine/threonine-protein kinase
VVTVHAFGEHDARPYLVMERIDGASLAVRCRESEPPTLAEAVAILDALCNGVQAIHDAGALHGDLKPGNVMLEREGRVAVTDFGLSRALHQVGRREPRFAFGTPGYLAPELAREEALEPRLATAIDIYALGVIAFELLTCRPLFEVRSLAAILHEHAYGIAPRPSTVRAGLPVAFDAPIARALAKSPAERTASADELRRALLDAARSMTDHVQPLDILVVDDEPGALFAVRELLLDAFPSAHVTTVTNTRTAAAIAIRERPDIIVTDLHMPDGGALELTTVLRAHESTRAIPIIVVTGMGGAQDWHELRSLGADRFLVKPIDFDALVAIIRSLIATAKTRREREVT